MYKSFLEKNLFVFVIVDSPIVAYLNFCACVLNLEYFVLNLMFLS